MQGQCGVCVFLYSGKETKVNSCYWCLWYKALALGLVPVRQFLEQPLIPSWEGLTKADHTDISNFFVVSFLVQYFVDDKAQT